MITGINESKTFTGHTCKCKFKFVGKKCNLDQWWNNNKCEGVYKKRHVCDKDVLVIYYVLVIQIKNEN